MSKRNGIVAVVILIGAVVLVTGGVRMRTASVLRGDASEFLTLRDEAQAAFHQDAERVSERYQTGELDEGGLRRETEAVQERFKVESEAAGVAWGDHHTAAGRMEQQGFMLVLAGFLCLVVGSGMAAGSRKRARSRTWSG